MESKILISWTVASRKSLHGTCCPLAKASDSATAAHFGSVSKKLISDGSRGLSFALARRRCSPSERWRRVRWSRGAARRRRRAAAAWRREVRRVTVTAPRRAAPRKRRRRRGRRRRSRSAAVGASGAIIGGTTVAAAAAGAGGHGRNYIATSLAQYEKLLSGRRRRARRRRHRSPRWPTPTRAGAARVDGGRGAGTCVGRPRIHEDPAQNAGAPRGASTDEEDAWDDDWGGTNDREAPAAAAGDDDDDWGGDWGGGDDWKAHAAVARAVRGSSSAPRAHAARREGRAPPVARGRPPGCGCR